MDAFERFLSSNTEALAAYREAVAAAGGTLGGEALREFARRYGFELSDDELAGVELTAEQLDAVNGGFTASVLVHKHKLPLKS